MGRITSLDIAKGVAIILVAAFHISQGLVASGLMVETFALHWVEKIAYGLHVQMFILITAYLAWPKMHQARFQAERFLSLYWAYLVWAGLSAVLAMVMPAANHPTNLATLAWLPIRPILHFWFLLALIVITVLLGLARGRAGLWLLGVAGVLVSATGFDVYQVAHFLPFAVAGALLREGNYLPPAKPLIAVGGFALLVATAWYLARTANDLDDIKDPRSLVATFGGVYSLYVMSDWLGRTPAMAWAADRLESVGTQSMSIYLSHGLFAVGARVIVKKVLVGKMAAMAWLAWPVCLVVAIVGPMVLAAVVRRLGLGRLAGFDPIRLARPAPAPAEPDA